MVRVTLLTDPADPRSWAAEPARRRLEVEFGDAVAITYVMAGLAREVADPGAMARAVLDAAAEARMPADPRLWLDGGPPASTYPACLAVKAAAEQGLDGPVLRVLREGFMVDGRRQDTADALADALRAVPGLDQQRFGVALRSNAIVEAFGADLERGRAVDVEHHTPGLGRVELPSIEFRGDGGAVHGVYGPAGYEAYRDAALAAGAEPHGLPAPSVEEALRRFGTMATVEVAAVCDLPGPRAASELWRAASEWRVRPERTLGGEVWSLA
jgi:predicted DsbA family dithiol-disulfide isomerase